jgi:hypothetical protein
MRPNREKSQKSPVSPRITHAAAHVAERSDRLMLLRRHRRTPGISFVWEPRCSCRPQFPFDEINRLLLDRGEMTGRRFKVEESERSSVDNESVDEFGTAATYVDGAAGVSLRAKSQAEDMGEICAVDSSEVGSGRALENDMFLPINVVQNVASNSDAGGWCFSEEIAN